MYVLSYKNKVYWKDRTNKPFDLGQAEGQTDNQRKHGGINEYI